ncbi:hypothetical protein Tco_0952598 [Tanacetum coccineum]|uniref:Uncharacterized protein n=1 Tax=Tanacetum coccineum TaxID=301880 RepID=A0ABQ5DY07_9ASTR
MKPNQTEGPPFTDHMKAICNLDVPMDFKAPKPSSQTEEVIQGKNPRAKSGLRRKQSSKHTSVSNTKASKSKTGQSKKTQSSSAKDKSPSHSLPPTLVVGEMHKEAQQVAGYPSLGATSEERAHPQLRTNPSVLVDQTKSAGDGLKTAHTDSGTNKESRADEISKKIKLVDLSNLLKDTRSAFFTPDSLQDEPIIVSDESEEEKVEKDDTYATSHDSQKDELEQQKAKAEAEVASLKARPSYPDINQLTDLLVTSLKPEFSKLLASHDFASCLPNALKELPSKFTELSGDIKELKKHVQDMEIELPGDLKEIPTKLETFTSTISSLSSQVAELKNIQWELPAEFTTMMENASGAARNNVPSTVDLLGIDMVEQYHNKKLLFDKYCDKMLKRRKSSKIINCDVLAQKGPISLKVYREDGTIKVIANFKTRMEYLDQTEKELKNDFNKPLKEQDPLNELNDLANKKRKRTGDSTDHSRSTKKHKSSVQHEEEVLRRLGSIFTSVYAAVQKLKKVFGKSFSSAWLTIPS